jgi:hypothetical protein
MRSFLVIDIPANWDDSRYRPFNGVTHSEEGLRQWVKSVWPGDIKATSSISEISAIIEKGGWALLEKK